MKLRGLVVALVILSGLVSVLYWSQHRKPPEQNPVAPAAAPAILKVDPANVTGLTIKQRDGQAVTLEKDASGKWQITAPQQYPADQETVAGMLSSLSALNADRVIDDHAAEPKQYGLDPPALELAISGKGQPARQLLLGDNTPAGSDVYGSVAGTGKVFTLAGYTRSGLAKSLADLRDKSLLTLDPDKVSRVELIKKPQSLEFDRTKGGWQMLKPTSAPADSSAVNSLISALAQAKMDLSGSSDAKAEFARAAPIATAKLTGDAGVQTLQVRKSNNNYYALSSVVAGAFKTYPGVGEALDKKADDFRKKN